MTTAKPISPLDPARPGTQHLASLEDAYAHDPTNVALARELAETYLDLARPGLAIAALRAGDPTNLEHPALAHRLAQAYEASGRVLDAYATADLALARCARSLGTKDAPSGTPVPRFECDARQHAVLEIHRRALGHMVEWGIADPTRDDRTEVAYDVALRRARIASAR
jgi:hypothetical protein